MAVTVRENDFYIGSSTRNSAAVFQIDSTTGGALFPRMSTTQRDAISSPPTGLSIFNTTTNQNETYNGTSWEGPGSGDVTGAASSTDNAVARFNGTGGKTIQNSGVVIDDNNEITGALSLTLSDSATTPPLNITERSTAPSAPATHDLYLDDGTNTAHGNPGFRRYNGSAFEDVGASGGLYTSIAIMRDEKSTTTHGGNSSATTWNNRDLNTEVADPDSIVSIASNQFTPVSGTYVLEVMAMAGNNASLVQHRLRLYNVTGAAVVDEGLNAKAAVNATSPAFLRVRFTANGTDAYRFDHYTTLGATNGLGVAVSDGSNEVYLEAVLMKEAA